MKALHKIRDNSIPVVTANNPRKTLEEYFFELHAYVSELKQNKDKGSFAEHEVVIVQLAQQIGRVALGEALEEFDVSTDIIQIENQVYRRKHKACVNYQTALGSVGVLRHVYVNRKKDGDGKSICPMELHAGVIEGYWTPQAAKNAMWAISHLTPHEAEELFLRMGGMSPSRSSLDRLPKIVNKIWEPKIVEYHEKLIEAEQVPEKAVCVGVSLDGVMIGMKPEKCDKTGTVPKKVEWREASCGTISFFDNEGERISTIEYGVMPEHKKETLKKLLSINIDNILKTRKDLKLVQIADGAQDNWTYFDEEMPNAFQVTDFYHACEYLREAFDGIYVKDKEKAKAKFEKYRHILCHDKRGVVKVLKVLQYAYCRWSKDNQAVADALTYFTHNQHRMEYAKAKELGYPIGSGVVEASCKSLVGQRMKRSGMSWGHAGGQGVLSFRALAKSHRFDQGWEIVAQKYRKMVKKSNNVIMLSDHKVT